MKILIEAIPNQSPSYYVIAYRLLTTDKSAIARCNPARLTLCKELKDLQLKNLIRWHRNSGIYFKDDASQTLSLANWDASAIALLRRRISDHQTANAEMSRQSSP